MTLPPSSLPRTLFVTHPPRSLSHTPHHLGGVAYRFPTQTPPPPLASNVPLALCLPPFPPACLPPYYTCHYPHPPSQTTENKNKKEGKIKKMQQAFKTTSHPPPPPRTLVKEKKNYHRPEQTQPSHLPTSRRTITYTYHPLPPPLNPPPHTPFPPMPPLFRLS